MEQPPGKSALVIGSGPNGLAAAIELARNGVSVRVLEAESEIGGAARSGELTLPGFVHDLGSAVHPLAVASPFFKTLPLERHGLKWIQPPIPLAHPLDDGTAVILGRSVEETAESLGVDSARYKALFEPLSRAASGLFGDILGPLRLPRHPLLLSRFGLHAILSARGFVEREFRGERAKALFAGLAGHSFLTFETPASAAIGLVLGIAAHAEGWPFPEGGAGRIAQALASLLREMGGRVETSFPVKDLQQIQAAPMVFFDTGPAQILKIGGSQIPESYRKSLLGLKRGPGVFKLDWALSSPIPWRAKECSQAGTIHLGGTFDEIADAEERPWKNETSERPYILLSQPSLFDPTRAPSGKHTAWAYCHVPWSSSVDMTERIEAQIERFAPGFRDTILHRSKSFPADLERQNRNLEGGDISGGAPTPMQMFLRPAARLNPYRIPGPHSWWICSSSSPPGPGVHGMCGYFSARAALK